MNACRGNSSFSWSWAGSVLSMLGSRTIGVTYPLLAYGLTQSPSSIAWVMFASNMPGLLWHVPAGAWIDRIGPRRVMTWSDLGRGLLLAGVAFALVTDTFELGLLLIVALVEGTLSVLSTVADSVLIPSTVKPDKVKNALALHEASAHGVVLAGRPLGGLLYGLSPIVSFIMNAVMFFGSAAILSRLPRDVAGRRKSMRELFREMLDGLSELRRNRFLCCVTLLTAFTNLMVQGVIVVFLSEATDDNLPSALAGAVLAASGVGGVIGAIMSLRRRRTDRWFQRRPVMLTHLWACTAALAIPLVCLEVSWSFAVALLVIGLAGGWSNVTVRTALSRVPPDRLARVAAVSRLGSYSSVAFGPLLAGLLVGWVESWVALLVFFALMGLLTLVMTAVPGLREALVPAPRQGVVRWEAAKIGLHGTRAAVRPPTVASGRAEVVARGMGGPLTVTGTESHSAAP
ncbi:MFS transporter [Nonomuraea fuscirosea]|uniref:MFS transporter n=1 Tax=Nonomuraea fuscirosea TaxID=1291556 RepID=UPI0033D734FD